MSTPVGLIGVAGFIGRRESFRYQRRCRTDPGSIHQTRVYPYRDLARWHQRILDLFGAKRLMWATDFPWILEDPGYSQLTGILKVLLPDLLDNEYDDIMGGNAKRFLRFPDHA